MIIEALEFKFVLPDREEIIHAEYFLTYYEGQLYSFKNYIVQLGL